MGLLKVLEMVKNVIAVLIPGLKKATSVEGVKELREMVRGVLAVAVLLTTKFKDGVQFTDFTEFYAHLTSDEDFKNKVKDAYDGYQKIPAEVKDIDAGEGLEVAGDIIDAVPSILEALDKGEKEEEVVEAVETTPIVDGEA